MAGFLRHVPAVVEHLVEELGRVDLRTVFRRDHAHRGLEHLAHPVGGHNLQILAVAPCGGAVGVQVVEQTARLVLLHIKARQAQQLAVRVARVHHTRAHEHALAVVGRVHLELVHVKTEFVEAVDALLNLPHLIRVQVVGVGERAPQRVVAVHKPVSHLDLVHVGRQQLARAQIHEFADDVGARQVDVVFALALGQVDLQFAGLGVHKERGERVGVLEEQHVRQRDVAPVETGEVQTHHQHSQGVDELFGSVGPQRACEQRTVRHREAQVLRHEDRLERLTLVVVAAGHHGDRLHGGQVELLQLAQQLVFAFGDTARDLLHRVHLVAHAHKAHDVAGDASRQVDEQVGRPCGERLFPWKHEHLGVGARGRDLQRSGFVRRRCGVGGFDRRGFQRTGVQMAVVVAQTHSRYSTSLCVRRARATHHSVLGP